MRRRRRSRPRARTRNAVFYAIQQRDGRYVSSIDYPIEWDRMMPLAFKKKRDAQAVVDERLDAAVHRLGIKVVRL